MNLLKKYIKRDTKVILAISGGPDSIYLLCKLSEYTDNVVLAHFNHKLRGRESNKDEKFCKKLAKKLNLEFETQSFDVRSYANKNSLNLEDAARKKRYKFLEEVRKKHKAGFILIAHHLNDNIETFLLNFLRGTGLKGLKSMQIRNGFILRPLLTTTKEEISGYLQKYRVKYRKDKSNKDIKFTRNKIRHEIIPLLKEIQPKLEKVFLQNWENMSEINDYFMKEAEKWTDLNTISDFLKLPMILQKSILQKIYLKVHGDNEGFSSNMLERALKIITYRKTGKKVPFGKKAELVVNAKTFDVMPKTSLKKILRKKINVSGKNSYNFGEFTVMLLGRKPRSLKNAIFLDYSKLKKPLYVRSKKNGDRFKPFGMKGNKKLQDFFVDNKIPAHERNKIPVFTDSEDQIVAVGMNTVSDNFKITPTTKKILKITKV